MRSKIRFFLFVDISYVIALLFLRFVEVGQHQLPQEARREEIYPRYDQEDRGDKHRSVLNHDGNAKDELIDEDVDEEDRAEERKKNADHSEDLKGFIDVTQKELEPEEVEEHGNRPFQAVF